MATTKAPRIRQPQIEIMELKNDRLVFLLSQTDISVANALRRVILAEVNYIPLTAKFPKISCSANFPLIVLLFRCLLWRLILSNLNLILQFFMTNLLPIVWASFLSHRRRSIASSIPATAVAPNIAQNALLNFV
jgi:hypothetical protein